MIDVTNAFASADETVVSWKGENYYKACDQPVVTNPDGSGTHCVKRVDHPGDIHEDYDGIRKTDPKGRMIVTVSFPLVEDTKKGHEETQAVLHTLRPHFQDKKDVLIYAAIREQADQIIMILDGDG